MSSSRPALAGVSSIALVLVTACGAPPRLLHTGSSHNTGSHDDVDVDDGVGEGEGAAVGGEGEGAVGVGGIDEDALPLVIRFREPGQHVVLNTMAGATQGP